VPARDNDGYGIKDTVIDFSLGEQPIQRIPLALYFVALEAAIHYSHVRPNTP
jgi:hypothetical protein